MDLRPLANKDFYATLHNNLYLPNENKYPSRFSRFARKHPDELDKLTFEKNIEYWDYNEGKMKLWRKEKIKWYENFENIEFNDGFFGFAPVKSAASHWDKVFENNQYTLEEI